MKPKMLSATEVGDLLSDALNGLSLSRMESLESHISAQAAQIEELKTDLAYAKAKQEEPPVKYYQDGGVVRAVYGTSSISYVEDLLERNEALQGLVKEMVKDNGQVMCLEGYCNFCDKDDPEHTPDCPITRAEALGITTTDQEST